LFGVVVLDLLDEQLRFSFGRDIRPGLRGL
jgi:hypothetical protein